MADRGALSSLRVLLCRVLTGHKRTTFELGCLRCRCGEHWTPRIVDFADQRQEVKVR